MAKLGNYIHYHRENYERSGINYKTQKNKSPNAYFLNYIEKARKQIINKKGIVNKSSSISDDTKRKFENIYAGVMRGQKKKINGVNLEKIHDEYIKDFTNELGDKIVGIGKYGSVRDNSQKSQDLKFIISQIKSYRNRIGSDLDTTKEYLTLEMIRKRYKKIIKDLGQEVSKASAAGGVMSNNSLKVIDNMVLELYNSIVPEAKKLITTSDIYKNKNIDKFLDEALKNLDGKDYKIMKKEEGNVVDALYNIYDYFKSPSTTTLQGIVGEDIGGLANEILNYNITKCADEQLSDFMKGFVKRKRLGSNNAVPISVEMRTDMNENIFKNLGSISEEKIISKDNNLVLKFGSQKIDIRIQEPGTSIDEGVSVKSYDLSRANWMHLLNGMPLLTLLLSEGIDFANHYLNAQAARHTEAGDKRKHNDDKIIATDEFVRQSNEALRLAAILTAFKGTKFTGHEQAKLFLVNDTSSGRVKLFDMNELIASLIDEKGAFSVKINDNPDVKKSNISNDAIKYQESQDVTKVEHDDAVYFYTREKDGAQRRVAQIIADTHAKKINVMVNARMVSSRM